MSELDKRQKAEYRNLQQFKGCFSDGTESNYDKLTRNMFNRIGAYGIFIPNLAHRGIEIYDGYSNNGRQYGTCKELMICIFLYI